MIFWWAVLIISILFAKHFAAPLIEASSSYSYIPTCSIRIASMESCGTYANTATCNFRKSYLSKWVPIWTKSRQQTIRGRTEPITLISNKVCSFLAHMRSLEKNYIDDKTRPYAKLRPR
jgi:hypothetical protein